MYTYNVKLIGRSATGLVTFTTIATFVAKNFVEACRIALHQCNYNQRLHVLTQNDNYGSHNIVDVVNNSQYQLDKNGDILF